MGDTRHVHNFLNIVGSQHSPAGLAAGHYVLVIAEDRKGGRRQRAGGNMEHR